jgi:cation/acetate symporter
MINTHPLFGGSASHQWWHIAAISAGVFGVPAGIAAIVITSLCTEAPNQQSNDFVDFIRQP